MITKFFSTIASLCVFFSASLMTVASYADTAVASTVTVQQIDGCSKTLGTDYKNGVKTVGREATDLVVVVVASASCGGLVAGSPQVVFKGKSADLTWVWTNPDDGPLAACLCARQLQFRIKDAPQEVVNATAKAR
jgi:hypothetical protein